MYTHMHEFLSFAEETVMCGLNEKKEPENIVGTKEALNVINLQSI